jgi:hypothetical protein
MLTVKMALTSRLASPSHLDMMAEEVMFRKKQPECLASA